MNTFLVLFPMYLPINDPTKHTSLELAGLPNLKILLYLKNKV